MGGIEDLYDLRIKAAEAGDADASRWLLKKFIASVRSNRDADGKPLPKPSGTHTQLYEPLLDYFAAHFLQILDGVPADKALGINTGAPGRGQKKDKLDRETEVTLAVLDLLNAAPNTAKKDAKQAVARKLKMNIHTVDAAWKNPKAQLAAKLILAMRKK